MLLKLVLDTNTLVSAFLWDGNEAALVRKIEQGRAQLFISQEILEEFEEVLKRPRFNEVMYKASTSPEEIVQKIASMAIMIIKSPLSIAICRDKDDNKFLECAVSAKADYIISGDNDLLSIQNYQGIRIERTANILKLI